jgi:oligopeptide transport system ATP-binding protein
LATNGRASGQALFNGQDLLAMKPAALNRVRGDRVAMIFQDPMTSLNPYLTVERQMTEVLELHKGLRRKARQEAGHRSAGVGEDPRRGAAHRPVPA